MALNTTGTITKVLPQEQIGKLTKQVFVIKTNDKYPQDVAFELYNDKCDLLKNFKENDAVEVAFNIKGREWKGKYYTSLAAWKISMTVDEVTNAQQNPSRKLETEDLPF